MKKILIPILFLLLAGPAMSQGWVFVEGLVISLQDSLPVTSHPVTIMADSANGVVYYNVVLTDSSGHYFDNVPVMTGTPGTLYVQTMDCNNELIQAFFTYDSVNTYFRQDFYICTVNSGCEANFSFYEMDRMTFQFQDLSLGNPQSWFWEFGDGQLSAEQNPIHYYSAGGWYNVTLTIGNEPAGCFDIYSSMLYVDDSSTWICQAYFEFIPIPEGSPDSFQFTDLSTGNIYSWLWDFGDGTFSQEQHPYHLFPGPGTYETCLVITGNNCTDTYCNTIMISDTVYGQIYGQVYAGNFPLQYGKVLLFEMNPVSGFIPRDESPVDQNGIYFFSLVPEGIYLVQAVPFDSNGFLPTYYGNVLSWQQSLLANTSLPGRQFDIYLVPAGPMAPGPGSVSGQINNNNGERAPINLFNMMLMDENGIAIGFSSVNNQGYFDFGEMGFGTYFLRAELSGVVSDNVRIEITPEFPHVDVVLNYSGTSVLGIDDFPVGAEALEVYPNPFSDRLTLTFNIKVHEHVEIAIYSMTGQVVYNVIEQVLTGQNALTFSLNMLPAGVYTLRISSGSGIHVIKKLLKN